MKEIELTQGKVAIVDDEDFERISRFKWWAQLGSRTWYAARNVQCDGKRLTQYMHRLILITDVDVDHINGNGLDNRRCNLRAGTRAQNLHNMHHRCGGTSRFKGVGWHKSSGSWRAYISVNDRHIHLGYFEYELAAARAYDAYAREHFGEFANLNFPVDT